MYPYDSGSPGVETLITPQSTEAAARQAVEEQKFGDEFNPKPNPDIEALMAKMNELEKECSAICAKLYGESYPTWQEREELHDRLNKVESMKSGIQGQLSVIYEGMHRD